MKTDGPWCMGAGSRELPLLLPPRFFAWHAIRVSPVCSRAFAYKIQAHLGPMVALPNPRSDRSWAITR